MWVTGDGAGAWRAAAGRGRHRTAVLRSVRPMLGLGLAATLGLAAGAALARAVAGERQPDGTQRCRCMREAGERKMRPASGERQGGREGPARDVGIRDGGDGSDRHSRRWTERRTTAGGRRSTVGPLIDDNVPGPAVGMGDGDDPGGRSRRNRPVTRRRPIAPPRFGPHRVGPYDVECVRPRLTDQLADREVSGLSRAVPGRAAAAVIEPDSAVTRRFHDVLDQLGRGSSVGVAVGQDEKRGGEAVSADMGDFPGCRTTGGELGGQRAAEDGTAAIPLAVRAYKDHRISGVLLPEAVMFAGAQGGEVQPKSRPRVGDGGGADPGTARSGVRDEQPASGNTVAVGVASRPADQRDAYTCPLCGGLQGPADVRVEVAVRQGLRPPRSGLLDEQPGEGCGCRPGDGLGRFTGSGSAGAHKGEPNSDRLTANPGRATEEATTSGGGWSCLRYGGVGHGSRALRRRSGGLQRRRPAPTRSRTARRNA